MLLKLAWRALTELSPRLAVNAAYLWVWKGLLAVRAYKKRLANGELYPPFMFVALTNTCNLRCHGCWVEKEGTAYHILAKDLDALINSGKKQSAYYYTLLGGEPFMYKGIWDVFRRHRDCYFQTITNGMLFTEANADRVAAAGNVTPLISIDGLQFNNDKRRGEGVFESALEGMARLKKRGVLFGTACTITSENLQEVLSDDYLRDMIRRGCMYIWYYVYRPVGEDPHPEYCLTPEQLVEARKRMIALRRRHPIIIIDSYWTADGEAFCPAAVGLGFHVGPRGSIEICPPLSFATDLLGDNKGDVYRTINNSAFLRGFEKFVKERTKGCVILEHPQELVEYIRGHGAKDYSGRPDALSEINAGTPRHSQHLPGQEVPEDYWVYRLLKKNVFFGMGAL
jgi:MoaA/NifB/PqqE/SkfB family radical SAM enzyme